MGFRHAALGINAPDILSTTASVHLLAQLYDSRRRGEVIWINKSGTRQQRNACHGGKESGTKQGQFAKPPPSYKDTVLSQAGGILMALYTQLSRTRVIG